MTSEISKPGGVWIGADPGGRNKFGVAALSCNGDVESTRLSCAREAVVWAAKLNADLLGVGVDAPLWWSSGASGARHADLWLRGRYPEARNSVMLINSIFGGVLIQGFLFAAELRQRFPNVPVTEAHPKLVLHAREWLFADLASEFGLRVDSEILDEVNDDRRDAVVAALAAREGFSGNWTHDLADLRPLCGEQAAPERALSPVNYWWFE